VADNSRAAQCRADNSLEEDRRQPPEACLAERHAVVAHLHSQAAQCHMEKVPGGCRSMVAARLPCQVEHSQAEHSQVESMRQLWRQHQVEKQSGLALEVPAVVGTAAQRSQRYAAREALMAALSVQLPVVTRPGRANAVDAGSPPPAHNLQGPH